MGNRGKELRHGIYILGVIMGARRIVEVSSLQTRTVLVSYRVYIIGNSPRGFSFQNRIVDHMSTGIVLEE
jgi:hypothetical protein